MSTREAGNWMQSDRVEPTKDAAREEIKAAMLGAARCRVVDGVRRWRQREGSGGRCSLRGGRKVSGRRRSGEDSGPTSSQSRLY